MPQPLAVIHAPRLDLAVMSPALMRALLDSDWDRAGEMLGAQIPAEWHGEDWQWLGHRPDQAQADPWYPRVMLLRAGRGEGGPPIVVGNSGFHGPPGDDGRVEIGYSVVSAHRRHGYAEETVRALIAWAAAEHGITRFRASISPDNAPSLNLIRKLGFAAAGSGQHEKHGEDLIFHRDAETRPAGR